MKNTCSANHYLSNLKDCLPCPYGSVSNASSALKTDCHCVAGSTFNESLEECRCLEEKLYPNREMGQCEPCKNGYFDQENQTCTNCKEHCGPYGFCNKKLECECHTFWRGESCSQLSSFALVIVIAVLVIIFMILGLCFLLKRMTRKTCSIKWVPTPSSQCFFPFFSLSYPTSTRLFEKMKIK